VHRLVVLVDAEERDVEVVARIREVVVIAAKKSDLLFGREDNAEVGILLEPIQPVLPAVVERDDVAPEPGLCAR
jgi:hypothetical protein